MRTSITYICILLGSMLKAQDTVSDSLLQLIEKSPADTGKVILYNQLVKRYRQLDKNTEALSCALAAEKLALQLNFKRGLPPALSVIGNILNSQGKYTESLQYHTRSLKLKEELGDSIGISASLNSLGNAFLYLGAYPEALDHYLRSVKIAEKINYMPSIGISLNNIVIIYNATGEFKKAEEHLARALEISQQAGDLQTQVNIYNNYGNLHSASYKDNDKARAYYQKALKLSEQIPDEHSIAISLGNIGITYFDAGDYKQALEYCLRSLKKHEETFDKEKIAYLLITVGNIYKKMGKYIEARLYCTRGLEIARNISSLDDIADAENTLSEICESTNDARGALLHYKAYIAARDSAFNEENTKKMVRSEMSFEFEKKEAAARAEQDKKDAVAEAEKKKQRIILLAISGFGLLILCFAVFAYRSFLQKKRANEEITQQKTIIEEKQKEIIASIYYARRIQRSLLPSEKYIEKKIKQLRLLL